MKADSELLRDAAENWLPSGKHARCCRRAADVLDELPGLQDAVLRGQLMRCGEIFHRIGLEAKDEA